MKEKQQHYLDLDDSVGTRIPLSPKAVVQLKRHGYKYIWEFDDGGSVRVFRPLKKVKN